MVIFFTFASLPLCFSWLSGFPGTDREFGSAAHQSGDPHPPRSRLAPRAQGESHVAARRAPSKVSLPPAGARGIWAFMLRQEVSGRESVPGGARLSRRPWGSQAAGRLAL